MTTTPHSKPDLLSGRTLFRAGLALLLLATVFFLRYSIEQGWIGPAARVGLAAAAGTAMVGIGMAVGRHRPPYGILLQGAGSAALFVTGFAAHDHYGLTSETEGFIQLVAVATLTLVLAHRSNSELLAGLGLGAAAASPALIAGQMAVPYTESVYLALIGATSAALFFRSGWWRSHTVAATMILGSTVLDLGDAIFADRSAALAAVASLVLAWSMLVIVPLVGTFTRTGAAVARISLPIITSAVGSLALYTGTRLIFADSGSRLEWTGFALGLAVGHLLVARGLTRLPEAQPVAAAQLVPALALVIVAAVEGLTGDWVLVGFSALSIGLVIAGHHGAHRRLADAGHVLFLLTAVLTIGVTAIVTSGQRELSELVPGMAVIATAAAIGVLIRRTDDRDLSPVYLAGAYFGALAWMAVEIPRLGRDGLAWVTAGWALMGVASIVSGRLAESRSALGLGFGAVGLSLGKLFFVDLAEVSPIVRIALFAGVGLLLVAGGYWLGDWSLDHNETVVTNATEVAD